MTAMSTHSTRTGVKLIGPLAAGAGVAIALGVYGRIHHPTGIAVSIDGFSVYGRFK